MIARGGRRDVFLGTRECQGYVEPCAFSEEAGFYDDYPDELAFGLMFHGFDYPDEAGDDSFCARFWRPRMVKGVVDFVRPDDPANIRKRIRSMKANPPASVGLAEEGLLAGIAEEIS